MKKQKKLCSLAIAIAFLLSGVPYPVYGVKSLAPASRYDGRGKEDEEHKRQVLQVLWFTNLEASRIIKENFTEEQIRYLAKALASLFVAGKFTPESIKELLREERLGTLDADERRGLAYQIHSMLGFVPVEMAKKKKVCTGKDIEALLSQKAVLNDEFLKTLDNKVVGYELDLNIKNPTDIRYIEAVRALRELRRRLTHLGIKPKAVVIISHRGRPNVKENPDDVKKDKFRIEVIAKWLSRDYYREVPSQGGVGEEIRVIPEPEPEILSQAIKEANGEFYFLQNTRLNPLITKKEDDPEELAKFASCFDALILGDWGRSGKGDLRGISSFVPTVLDSIAYRELETMISLMNSDKPILTILAGTKPEKAEQFLPLVERHKTGSTIYVLGPTGYTVETIVKKFILGEKPQLGKSKLVISQEVLDMLGETYSDKPMLKNKAVIDEAIKDKIRESILGGISDKKELKDKKKKLEQGFKIIESVAQGWLLAQRKGIDIKWVQDHLVTTDANLNKGEVEEESRGMLTDSERALFFGERTFNDIVRLIKSYDNVYVFGAPGVFENEAIAEHQFNRRLLGNLEANAVKRGKDVFLFGGDTDIWAQEYKIDRSTGGGSSLETWIGKEPAILTSAWDKTKIQQLAESFSKVDLQQISGLPIKLGADNKLIFGEGLTKVVPAVRILKADGIKDKEGLKKVVKDPTIITEENKDTILYDMYRAIYEDEDLRYDITVIPPAMLGTEYVKTTGHFHPGLYPEVYEVLNGEAYYLLQKKDGSDFIIVHARKGDKVVIPPNYGHITVNAGKKTLVMANWVSNRFKSEYGEIKKKRGAMYYLEEGENGELKITRNPNYEDVPGIQVMRPADLIDRFGLERNVPMYSLISEAPEKLDFLNNPGKYEEAFAKALIEVKTTDVEPILAATEKELAELIGVGTQPSQLKNKALYVSWEILLETVGIEKFFKKLDSLLSKSESTCVKIVIPDFPHDGKIPDDLKRMLPMLVKFGEEYRSLEIVTEADAKREIEGKSERLAELRNIAAVVKEETQTDWWHKVLDSMVIKIAKPTKEQISLVLVAIISGFDILVDSQISLLQLRNWLEENYKGKIKSEQISRLLYHLSMNLAFEPVEPTTAFLEDYQLLLKREELLRQAG